MKFLAILLITLTLTSGCGFLGAGGGGTDESRINQTGPTITPTITCETRNDRGQGDTTVDIDVDCGDDNTAEPIIVPSG